MNPIMIIHKSNLSKDTINKTFELLENAGYKTIIKDKFVGVKEDTKVWVAININGTTITYDGASFSKDSQKQAYDYFTEEEYNIIKGE